MIEPSVKILLEGLAAIRDLIACRDLERASALCDELLAMGLEVAEIATCYVCGGAATKLCDFRLGWAIGGYVEGPNGPYAVFDITRMPYTCDMPLCDACAYPAGRTFVSGQVPAADTIDYCPLHAHVATRPEDMRPITPEAAAVARAKAWAAAVPTAVVTPQCLAPGSKEE